MKVLPDRWRGPGLKKRLSQMNDSIAAINTLPKTDEIVQFLNTHTVVNVSWMNHPLFGVISDVGPTFISLKKRDGRVVKIRRSSILGIEEMRPEAIR